MRVQMKYSSAATNSCTTFTYGEVEDYTVNITGNAAFTIDGTSNPVIAADVLYPNPVSDRLHLSFNSSAEGSVILSVYNVTGQWMKSSEFRMSEGSNDFDMSTAEFPAGLYLLKVSGDMNQTYRFMIAK
jgi:hypothetical protein